MYTIIDHITGETLKFVYEIDAEMEAERRLTIHNRDYPVGKHGYHKSENIELVKIGKEFIIR